MKTHLILITMLLFLTSLNVTNAQKKKGRTYKTWVEISQTNLKYKGQLIQLKDSSIVIQFWQETKTMEIPVKEIHKLKFRKKGAIGMGAGIGAGVGILTGAIAGIADGDDPPAETWFQFSSTAEEKATGGAITLGILGAATGSVIGSIKKKFTLNATQENYNRFKPDLNKYLAN
ncbi:hypothetical protein [Lutimonas sp.]|uniref:hypothetical protein n=1 Tax=Lutimonas sp. TaxID=1872403 RepID=UPI003D9AEBAB